MGGVISVQLWRELRAERELVAQLRNEMNELRAQPALRPATANMAPPGLPPAAAPGPVPGQPPAAGEPARPQAGGGAAMSLVPAFVDDRRELLKDPEYRKARLAQMRIAAQQNSPGLAEELGLTPEEASRLFDVLAESQLAQSDINTGALLRGLNGAADPAAVEDANRRQRELAAQRDQQLEALLGSGRLAQYKEYEGQRSARISVAQWDRAMESVGVPMTSAQSRPLVAAYAAEQKRQAEEMSRLRASSQLLGPAERQRLVEEQVRLTAESNRHIIDAARSHLTTQQLEALQGVLDQQLAVSRATSASFERVQAIPGEPGQPVLPR